MKITSFQERREQEQLTRTELEAWQLHHLNHLLAVVRDANAFYQAKHHGMPVSVDSLNQFGEFPLTTKDELIREDNIYAANLTYPMERYSRFHRTSGTKGNPLVVLDTVDDWEWWINTWQFVLDAADVGPSDRAAMAFSFGPFIGFWSANDALVARGALVIPCGGMDTLSRLEIIRSSDATVVCCTPTYALRMAEVAATHHIDIRSSSVTKIIVAGEPGGSLPSVRERIESAWSARVIDHSGATEVGPWGYGSTEGTGLHVVESEFIAEFLAVETGQPAAEGELAQLILTPLRRTGCPVIRYATGDLVRPRWNDSSTNRFVYLEGGVLGRADDMLIIRGVNIFPSSVEQIVRSFPEVKEFRMIATRSGEMDALRIEVEDEQNAPERIAKELRIKLGLNVEVTSVEIGSLPRFEAKSRRFIDNRNQAK